jgi:FxsC-like protein
MTVAARAGAEPTGGCLFYVSYARSRRLEPDSWVRSFYADLLAAVERHATPRPGWEVGFLDPGALDDSHDGKSRRALSLSEVFVALFSEGYLTDSRAGQERAAFLARLGRVPERRRAGHFVPVLWEPPVDNRTGTEFAEARAFAAHVFEYAEHGLAALCRLRRFRAPYLELLGLLAGAIVRTAEASPIGPGEVSVSARRGDARHGTLFVIGVLAPTKHALPPGRQGDCYGDRPIDWRPYDRPIGPVAARRVPGGSFHTRVTAVALDDGQFANGPGVLLIDPWILAFADGRDRLTRTLSSLPRWVMPVVIANNADPQYSDRGQALCAEATGLCDDGRSQLLTVRNIREAVGLDVVLGYWIRQAVSRFQKYGEAVSPHTIGSPGDNAD